MDRDIFISVATLSFCGVIFSSYRTWVWSKRAGKRGVDSMVLSKLLISTCGVLANVICVVNVGAAIVWFCLFKKKAVVRSIPTPPQELYTYIYFITALVLKSIQTLHDLTVSAKVDLFFIDWEKPKTRHLWTQLIRASTQKKKDSLKINEDEKTPESPEDEVSEKGKSHVDTGINIWRSYFVANEWVELYPYRSLSLEWHMLFMVLCLNIISPDLYRTNAKMHTHAARNETHPHDVQTYMPQIIVCRTAGASLVYMSLVAAQLIYKKMFYEKYIHNKLQEFVDLCTVCNVSVFVWVSRCYGFYIHGKSPSGKADVSMREMYEQLKREEEDASCQRGLVKDSDQQTFEILLPASLNDQYKRFRYMLTAFSPGAERLQGIGGRLSRVDIEKLIPTYLNINKFLAGFIDHTYKDLEYVVKDKSTSESILDTEFDDPRQTGLAYFYNDYGQSFELCTFYGMEMTLICFELMLFIVTDLWFASFPLSAVITYFTSTSLKHIFIQVAKRNVVSKALVDERFLV